MASYKMEEEIVKWIHYDNKLKEYNEKSKKLREEKDKMSEKIFEYYDVYSQSETKKNSELPQFNVPALKAKLCVNQTTHYESLNYKFLTKCLEEYFDSSEKAEEIVDYIRGKRTHESKIALKRESTD